MEKLSSILGGGLSSAATFGVTYTPVSRFSTTFCKAAQKIDWFSRANSGGMYFGFHWGFINRGRCCLHWARKGIIRVESQDEACLWHCGGFFEMEMLKTDTSARPQDTHLFTLRVLCGFLIRDDFLMSTSVVFTHPGWKWRKKKDKGSFRCASASRVIINELLCRVWANVTMIGSLAVPPRFEQ